ncbi:MAG: hypothetical protein Fur0036_08740 [Fimbriimonadaceae bacterium]
MVSLMGAGNVLVSAPALATLITFESQEWELRLYDAHEERLDLADLLARTLNDGAAGSRHRIRSSNDPAEMLEDADIGLLMVDEGTARRMKGTRPLEHDLELDMPRSVLELRRGDPNQPTPPDQLSPRTRTLLEVPIDQETPGPKLIAEAVEKLMSLVSAQPHWLWLGPDAPAHLPANLEILDWPPALSPIQEQGMPHQVMRWAMKTEPMDDLLKQAHDNPLQAWLKEHIGRR